MLGKVEDGFTVLALLTFGAGSFSQVRPSSVLQGVQQRPRPHSVPGARPSPSRDNAECPWSWPRDPVGAHLPPREARNRGGRKAGESRALPLHAESEDERLEHRRADIPELGAGREGRGGLRESRVARWEHRMWWL